jgi:hypothetical protein
MKLSLFFLSAAAMVNAATADGVSKVNLGEAADYAVLTKAGISTAVASTITGDIGVSPIAATAITGFSLVLDTQGQSATSTQVTGVAHAASYGGPTAAGLTTAVSNMETAYTDAAGRAPTETVNLLGGAIGGATLAPGVYEFGSDISITENLILLGSATDVFIFKTTNNLLLAASTSVILNRDSERGDNAAVADNVFWQVTGQVKVGAGSHMEGTILVKTDAEFLAGSSLNGRVLAQTACTLDGTAITKSSP